MQRNSQCSGECCYYLHVEGHVRVEVGVQCKWREVCSVQNEQEETSFSEPAGVFRGFSHHLPMSSLLVVYTQLVFVEKYLYCSWCCSGAVCK